MNDSYKELSAQKLILRDHLAIERTGLANERTLLAYIRTALALAVTGASALHFFSGNAMVQIFGLVLMAAGITAAIVGFIRFKKVKRAINQ